MKTKDILKLKTGAKVKHKRYGLSEVEQIIETDGELFGLVIVPSSNEGKRLLMSDSGGAFPRLLEGSPRQILQADA